MFIAEKYAVQHKHFANLKQSKKVIDTYSFGPIENTPSNFGLHISTILKKIEKMQRRATKLIPTLRKKPYEDILTNLEIYLIEIIRLRGQLIDVFKILNESDNVDLIIFFFETTKMTCRIMGLS